MKNPDKVAPTFNLEKVLLDYSCLATVLLAVNGSVMSQSCLSPGTMMPNDTIKLDIDGDGAVDFALVNNPFLSSTVFQSTRTITGLCTTSMAPVPSYSYRKISYISSFFIKNDNRVSAYNGNRWMRGDFNPAFAGPVPYNGVIGVGESFGAAAPALLREFSSGTFNVNIRLIGSNCTNSSINSYYFSYSNPNYRTSGYFNGGTGSMVTSEYLGVEFKIGANLHYAWLELKIPNNGSALELVAYCYNPTPGGSIQAGMMAVLPVEIASYSVRALENSIQINWTTASEVNHEGFEIQRSVDGLHFSTIASQPSAHNSNEINNYEYTDREIEFNQRYYYRLKSIDQDGTVEYGNVESAIVEFSGFTIGEPYPNPVPQANTLQIPISGKASGEVNVSIFDTKGALLKKHSFSQQEGSKELSVDTDGLRAGMYIVSIAHLGEMVYKKIIID